MKNRTGLYQFLKERDLLNPGADKEDVMAAKLEYTRLRQNKWARERSKHMKSIKVWLTRKEAQKLLKEAERFGLSKTAFLKKSCFAHIDQSFLIPNKSLLQSILAQLELMEHMFQSSQYFDEGEQIRFRKGLMELQQSFHEICLEPHFLLHELKTKIEQDPKFRSKVLEIISDDY